MRKIFNFMVATVDGYFEGPNGEFDWPNPDEEFNEFARTQLSEVDTLLFGRRTYEGMAQYWPSDAARDYDPEVADTMNNIAKIVVSRTLDRADWTNTRLIKDDPTAELAKLKEAPGRSIAIFGSSDLTADLVAAGLVDELRIMYHPIVLGAGHSVFHTTATEIPLTLLSARIFNSGNVLLCYAPALA